MKKRSPQHVALGLAIKSLRKDRQVSQEGLALQSGLDRAYVGGIERGEKNPTYATLLVLADTLEVPLSTLMLRAEQEMP